MSKTLVSILEVGAIIGLQFIPGVGQAVAGAIGAAGIGGVTAAQGLAVASFALAATEGLVNSLLTKSPAPSTTETAIKSSIASRVSGYGERRLQGAYILFDTAPNGWACDAWVFHDGQVASVGDKYIGDRKVSLLSGGWVLHQENGLFGKENNCVQIEYRLGLPTETPLGSLIYNIPDHWTVNHRGDGCVTGSMISKNVKVKDYPEVYATGGPDRTPLSLAMRLQLVFDWRDEDQVVTDPRTWKYSENAWLHVAHYELVRAAIGPALPPSDPGYWDGLAATYGARWARLFAPTLAYWTAAADDADLPVPLAGVQTVLAGRADEGDTSINVYSTNGLEIGMQVAIFISGDNANTEYRTVTGIAGPFISFTSGLARDHPQGSQVTWASESGSPATEPRYRGCVVHAHSDAHKTVRAKLLACCDGWLSPRADGALVPYSGRYYEPDEADEIGPAAILSYSIQEGVNEEDALNTLKVTYISANHDFNTVDTDDWVDSEDLAARGKELSDNIANDVPSHAQARRLAKRANARVMAPSRGTVSTNSLGRKILGKRYIPLSIIEAGATLFVGTAEITKVVRNMTTGGVSFDWIAADPNIDAWNPATEEGLPAPVGNRQSAPIILAPTVISAVYFGSDDSGTGTAGARIRITIAAQVRDDLTWFARWRVVGAAAWNEQQYTDVDGTALVVLETSFVPVGADIEVEAAYQTGNGIVSPWSTPSTEVGTGTTHFDDTTTTFDSINVRWDRT